MVLTEGLAAVGQTMLQVTILLRVVQVILLQLLQVKEAMVGQDYLLGPEEQEAAVEEQVQ
jgi:hypothetical protein